MSKLKRSISTLFLILVISSYCGYYFETALVIDTFSEAKQKIDTINNLLSPSIQGQEILKDFGSVQELKQFLISDDTNEIVYSSPDFVCHHFSERLIRNAREEGYRLEYLGIYGDNLIQYQNDYVSYLSSYGVIGTWGEGEGHAVCVSYINGDTIVIEPQTDTIFRYENNKYYGVYIGEK